MYGEGMHGPEKSDEPLSQLARSKPRFGGDLAARLANGDGRSLLQRICANRKESRRLCDDTDSSLEAV